MSNYIFIFNLLLKFILDYLKLYLEFLLFIIFLYRKDRLLVHRKYKDFIILKKLSKRRDFYYIKKN